MSETDAFLCPLCQLKTGQPYFEDHRQYFYCPECALVFVPPTQFISAEEEKVIYELHENSAEDTGYRHFLMRMARPLLERLKPASQGLDFGSGPGPVLATLFNEAGHSVENYDLFFAHKPQLLAQQYDFITATEVVEHLHHPRQTLERLWTCLKPQGILGIMTKRVIDQDAFSRWHYKNDITHVCFFSEDSFQWLAQHWQATLVIPEKDVVLLIKQ
ncbi:class I SAM-dependent methyltransferase [sulfur-oxidizing endosymbiont of Gigantopelta aegis]|uniref:class I SAM-dependent methyltransferase n=1 Tax=sulfur-oxidizing endosymbiont of Gigantopelta aegis TaxID=2794934 RepID=UPI0018DDBCF4|nr:class I SAM-dependent methyltransferase [sulfur-oxidizing endosymbiont of Gigantopelta aegis]